MSQAFVLYAIKPVNFGEYQSIKISELSDEEYGEEILDAILIDSVSILPEGAKDIRGLIHNEPDDIYVREVEEGLNFDKYEYFGISLEGESDLDEVGMEALSSLSKF